MVNLFLFFLTGVDVTVWSVVEVVLVVWLTVVVLVVLAKAIFTVVGKKGLIVG